MEKNQAIQILVNVAEMAQASGLIKSTKDAKLVATAVEAALAEQPAAEVVKAEEVK